MSQLSKGIALTALAREIDIAVPKLLDALKNHGLCSQSVTSAESLPVLSPNQVAFLREHFAKDTGSSGKGFTPSIPAKSPKKSVEPKLPQSLPFKTLEQLAAEWEIKPVELMRLVNLTATAWNIQFAGRLDDNWEFLITRTQSEINAEYGGKGDKTPEEYINDCHKELLSLEPAIADELTAQETGDEVFVVNNLGEYVQEMATGDLQYHQALVQALTLKQVDALEEIYDRSRFSRAVLVGLAQRLESRTQQLRETNAINSGKSISDRIQEMQKLAGRISQIALAPVASDRANALAIRAAITASANRPA